MTRKVWHIDHQFGDVYYYIDTCVECGKEYATLTPYEVYPDLAGKLKCDDCSTRELGRPLRSAAERFLRSSDRNPHGEHHGRRRA